MEDNTAEHQFETEVHLCHRSIQPFPAYFRGFQLSSCHSHTLNCWKVFVLIRKRETLLHYLLLQFLGLSPPPWLIPVTMWPHKKYQHHKNQLAFWYCDFKTIWQTQNLLHTEILCYKLGKFSLRTGFLPLDSIDYYFYKGSAWKQIFKNMKMIFSKLHPLKY